MSIKDQDQPPSSSPSEQSSSAQSGLDNSIDTPWALSPKQVIEFFGVSIDEGLSPETVRQMRKRYGQNQLRSADTTSALSILLEQLKSVIVALLAVVSVVSFLFGEMIEGVAVAVVIVINTVIGFVMELRAVRSMEALQELSQVDAKVLRKGQPQEIPAEKIVPGDVLLFDGGDVVTADVRLFESSKLQADESALTGESVPVSKRVEAVDGDALLADRTSMLFKGTAVTRGSGKGIVVATGMNTELGNISSLVDEADQERTPLERRLGQLGRRLIWVSLGIVVLVALSGILRGRDPMLMLRSAIALAVASVPEGLPIVATVALARGMWRMARRNAIVNRLSAVETLGSTNVILTDKTGTLTENRMTVAHVVVSSVEGTPRQIDVDGQGLKLEGAFQEGEKGIDPEEHSALRRSLKVGVLCTNANLQENGSEEDPTSVGEPTEVALLVAGMKAGLDRDELLEQMPERREVAFDPQVNMMATFHDDPDTDDGYFVAVKGALEPVLDASTHMLTPEGKRKLSDKDREEWLQFNSELAQKGLRVLATASRTSGELDDAPYKGLTFLGFQALLDPPRSDVGEAIEAAQSAGVRVVMVTGDQPPTARNVAYAVGLVQDEDAVVIHGADIQNFKSMDSEERERMLRAAIFARVSPEQKLDLITLQQENGAIVAMTGDGVNDAPALKKADIGIAMGERGTQVAKEAADMVLKDDRFSTIIAAIRQGRAIFDNIRKFVLYLLSCNVAEIMVVGLASLADAPLPILPLQILFLNLVTDVFPALALGVGEGDPRIMERSPRDPDERVLTSRHWLEIFGYSSVISIAVLGALAIAMLWMGVGETQAVSISFLTLAFAQLWHVFNMRGHDSGILDNDVVQNPWVWGALGLCTFLLIMAVYVPGLANLLTVQRPNGQEWALIVGMSFIPWIVGLIAKKTANI